MLKKLSFRSKLLLVLFVPFLALVVIAAAGLRDRFVALRAQEQYGEISAPMRSLDALSRALENEAVLSSWYVVSDGEPQGELTTARARTDAAARVFRTGEQRFLDAGVSGSAVAALETTNAGLDAMRGERRRIDALDASASQARGSFLGVDDDLLGFGQRVARDLRDPQASASVSRSFALQREEHELAREAGIRVEVVGGEQASSDGPEFTDWVSAIAAQERERSLFVNGATGAEVAALTAITGTEGVVEDVPAEFPTTGETPAAIVGEYQDRARELDRAIVAVDGVISDASVERADAAQRDVLVYGGLAVLAMFLTLGLMWFVSRAVVRPVRRLTDAAREMSQRQLPQLVELLRVGGDISTVEPTKIDVSSEDEIAELARAFNDVQTVTMDVAHEQSRLLHKGMGDLFVNLARRNQSLLERQLELLDDLERNEHDPAALDSLFKLDHMATRMRRNAESLLVLSGAEQPRQWQQPIALLDVVRAAAAEIADFPRVEMVGIDDDLAVGGRAVADVAHLVAELLENATSFSPPDSAVVVSGATTSSGFVLAISDQGIGMPADRIREANELLARPPVVGLALSRALGLHVVASLAARHAITVELRPGAPVGLVALVTLPGGILERAAADAMPEPVFVPDVGPDGAPTPLGARRATWRPSDEPPVEEWLREGLGAPTAPTDVPAEPAAAAEPEPPSPPFAAAPPRREAPAPDEGTHDATAGTPHDERDDDAPLPTRVPGRHMSHQPNADPDSAGGEADPLRPYRVHEFLSRHDQGKRRGRAEVDVPGHGTPDDDGSLHGALDGSDGLDGPDGPDGRVRIAPDPTPDGDR